MLHDGSTLKSNLIFPQSIAIRSNNYVVGEQIRRYCGPDHFLHHVSADDDFFPLTLNEVVQLHAMMMEKKTIASGAGLHGALIGYLVRNRLSFSTDRYPEAGSGKDNDGSDHGFCIYFILRNQIRQ